MIGPVFFKMKNAAERNENWHAEEILVLKIKKKYWRSDLMQIYIFMHIYAILQFFKYSLY